MKRLTIERLDLDLTGVPRETAAAAARLVGPALARALAGRRLDAAPADRIDAGRLASPASPEAGALAARIAHRIAAKTSRGPS